MQTTINEQFARRRARIGRWSTILGFAVLLGGMYVSLTMQRPERPEQLLIPWLALVLGIILLNIGKYHTIRWGTNPRVDQALVRALKGLDHRYHLYSFVPDLPAEHILVTPQGIIVLEPRPFIGEIIHEGRSWRRPMNLSGLLQRFADGGLGNPTTEALQEAAALRTTLKERLGEQVGSSIPIFPMVVLTNPRVKLRLNNPEVPVVMLADIRAGVRQLRDSPKMPTDIQRQLARVLRWELPDHALSTTRSSSP